MRLVNGLETSDEAQALRVTRNRARMRLDAERPEGAPSRNPFHWPIAFPEVFDSSSTRATGFDAMVGNPPFIGGQKISGAAGTDYRGHLVTWIANGAKGSADLVAYFFLNATKVSNSLGYLATNTIAQGDTSEVGLTQIIDKDWTIHRAVSSTTWPGEATLEIAKVWATAELWHGAHVLDGRRVQGIDEMLYAQSRSGWRKQRLAANGGKSFQGSIVLGMGFTMSPEEAYELIDRDPKNADVLFPYLGGEDLNGSPTQTSPRWIVNFFDWSEERARSYPDCFAIVEEKVKPARSKLTKNAVGRRRAKFWWQYGSTARELYRAIDSLDRVLAIALTSKAVQPAFASTSQVFSHSLGAFAYDDYFHFGVLTSWFHYRWATRFASSMRTDTRYTPSDVFETFPLPPRASEVEAAGEVLDGHRSRLMAKRQLGLTSIYNRVHDPSEQSDVGIGQLRDLHIDLDLAVRDAYGWSDLPLSHGFHEVRGQGIRFTFSPESADEVLDRLLELNKARYEAEVAAGLHKPARKAKASKARLANQGSLLDDDA